MEALDFEFFWVIKTGVQWGNAWTKKNVIILEPLVLVQHDVFALSRFPFEVLNGLKLNGSVTLRSLSIAQHSEKCTHGFCGYFIYDSTPSCPCSIARSNPAIGQNRPHYYSSLMFQILDPVVELPSL